MSRDKDKYCYRHDCQHIQGFMHDHWCPKCEEEKHGSKGIVKQDNEEKKEKKDLAKAKDVSPLDWSWGCGSAKNDKSSSPPDATDIDWDSLDLDIDFDIKDPS